ncbi:hypothetical protein ACT453_31490, partial [Bacillus sp. D-CC]
AIIACFCWLIPCRIAAVTEKQYRYLKLQITQTFQANMFLTLPAVVGISSLAYPIYTAFYDADPLGGQVLMWYAPVALLFALFTVTAAILQGINQQKHAIIALIMGVILKFVCTEITNKDYVTY